MFCQSAKPRMQVTRSHEATATTKDSENADEPEDTCQGQDDGEVVEHCSDSQELPPAQDKQKVNDIERSAALDDERWMKDPRAALRAAAAEAAQAEKEREERMKKRAADQEQRRQQQAHSQVALQQVKSLELLPSPAPSGRFAPSQNVQHDSHGEEEEASKQTQQKSRSLGRPCRLSAAYRARRDTISLAAKTPPRHRTPPPQQLASRSPQGALMGSPMGLASALTSSRPSNGIRRALFSPSASVPGKKWGPGSLSRSCKGLGSPSRRESRVRRGGC